MATNEQEILDALDKVIKTEEANKAPAEEDLTLEALTLLTTMEMVKRLEEKSRRELDALKERQEKVTFLHKIQKAINKLTEEQGTLDLSDHPEIKELLEQAKELGVDIDLEKNSYTMDERYRLVENIRMTCDDLNIQNDMQIQAVTRLTNQRYEAFQVARSILKPLHEDKVNKARSISGR